MLQRIGIFLVVLVTGCGDSRETRMQRFLIQGNEKFEIQDYDEAAGFFKEALSIDSCFADAWHNLGTVEYRKANLKTAIICYSRAIECQPDFVSSYLGRANIFYELNEFESAERDLKSAERLAPDTSTLHYIKGLVFWKEHQTEKAMEQFRKILLKNPQDVEVLVNLGTLYGNLHKYDSGRLFLNEALKLAAEDSRPMNALAILEADAGNMALANTWIDKALARNSEEPFYMNNKGYILLLQQKYDEALSFIDKSIGLDPYNGWAYRNKGLYYYHTGNVSEAIRLLKQAETIDPLIDQLYYWLGQAYLRDGKKDIGCQYFMKALSSRQMTEEQLSTRCK